MHASNSSDQQACHRRDGIVEPGPQVTLYANRSEESQRAFEALEKSGISFRVIPSPRRKCPVANFGSDEAKGLADIQNLIDALHAFQRALLTETLRTAPHFFDHPDEALARHMAELKEAERAQARRAMSELLNPQPAGKRSAKKLSS